MKEESEAIWTLYIFKKLSYFLADRLTIYDTLLSISQTYPFSSEFHPVHGNCSDNVTSPMIFSVSCYMVYCPFVDAHNEMYHFNLADGIKGVLVGL